jgi:hypothetical protein
VMYLHWKGWLHPINIYIYEYLKPTVTAS